MILICRNPNFPTVVLRSPVRILIVHRVSTDRGAGLQTRDALQLHTSGVRQRQRRHRKQRRH